VRHKTSYIYEDPQILGATAAINSRPGDVATGIPTLLLSGSWEQRSNCDVRASLSGVVEHSRRPGRDDASAGKYLPTKSLGLVDTEDGGNMCLQKGDTE
jgi:hypothetical protein